MSRITADLLSDTLHVISLARETALARGGAAQAERLKPVEEGLRSLASAARETRPAAPSGPLAQADFQALLAAAQSGGKPGETPAGVDRGQVVAAMSAGGMGEIDIARHLGLEREEVRLALATRPSTQTAVSAYNRALRGEVRE